MEKEDEDDKMRNVVETLREKGKIYKKLFEVEPKQLGVRNKIKIYHATDIHGYFTALFIISQKSRVLMKDVRKMEEIYQKLVIFSDHNFKYKLIKITAPLCSKAEKAFIEAGWKLI
ncbi:MAG: hypothetical protein U9Q62_00395 [Campylobacterota bacterium]|nr:hypothetical protein [Campylobacterota bacterium]